MTDASQSKPSYVLGTDDAELQRLRRQQATWARETTVWIDRLRLGEGDRVVDAGCGPGFVVPELLARVGGSGRVLAVDGEERYLADLRTRLAREPQSPVAVHHARLESFEPELQVDGVFARWVLTFPPEPGAIVERMASWLKPGGRLVLVDYNHEGISLYPDSPGFRRVVHQLRAWFAERGGDAFVAGRIPHFVHGAGLELESLEPTVRCGGPGGSIWSWAEEFFLHHSGVMEDEGWLTGSERAAFVEEWQARRKDPNARFYTPIQVCATARKPS